MGRMANEEICFEHRISDWLETFFQSIGAPYERLPVVTGGTNEPRRDNVIARFDSHDAKCTMLWDVHQDTVPVDGMTIAPFDPQCVDGKIYGRGAADVKGSMAAMLVAFARLFRERPAGAANVVFSCTCDEEATATGVRDLITYWQGDTSLSKLLFTPPDIVVVAEPTELDVVVAHRGVVRFRIRSSGIACHSSHPEQGRNAIYIMARVVQRLEEHAHTLLSSPHVHPLCGGPRLSVGRIDGGVAVNVVPEHCQIEVDRRLIPGEDPLDVSKELQALVCSVDPSVTCDAPWLSSPALSDSNNSHLAAELLKSIACTSGDHRSIGVPFCTNASTIGSTSIPTVVFGPGAIEQAHTCDEWISIKQLDAATEIFYDFACNYRPQS
jgi:acetylornithine deacetylase/succinyl-diaminopimelate desuccinylase-like protein